MANIHGDIWLIDEPNVNIVHKDLQNNFPIPTNPMAGAPGSVPRVICMNMDETDDTLDKMYPNTCLKATVLCPPPSAMYREVDGDHEGFVEEYMAYLASDIPSEFIAAMLFILYKGGNILLYTPSYIEDDSIWTNTLINYIFINFGISMGVYPGNFPTYDERYDITIAEELYKRNCISVFEFISITPQFIAAASPSYAYNPQNVIYKIMSDLAPLCNDEDDPYQLYEYISYCTWKRKNMMDSSGIQASPMVKPGIIFVK